MNDMVKITVHVGKDKEDFIMHAGVFAALMGQMNLVHFYAERGKSGAFGVYQGVTLEHVRGFVNAVTVL